MKQNLPYSVAALVLGICSIVFSCVFAGIVCGILGLVFSSKAFKAYALDPDLYTGTGMAQAGRITSIIGLCIGVLSVIYWVFIVFLLGLGTLPMWCNLGC